MHIFFKIINAYGYNVIGNETQIKEELTADVIGDYLFNDTEFINKLSTNKNVFQKIYNYIKEAYTRLKGTDEEKKFLELKNKFEEVYKTIDKVNTSAETGARYSLKKDIDNSKNKLYNMNIGDVSTLNIDDIYDLENSGGYRTEEQLSELRESIKENGITTPIEIYKKNNGEYAIENGNHRLQIAKELGINNIPIKIVESWENIGGSSSNNILDGDYNNGRNEEKNNSINEDSRSSGRGNTEINIAFKNGRTINENAGIYENESNSYKQTSDVQNNRDNKQLKNSNKSSFSLEERVSGDKLLNAQDLIEEIKSVGAKVDNNGYVTVYHQTTQENADNIIKSGKMSAKEDGIFFSTLKNAQQSEGKGNVKLEFKIPAEDLVLDDIFIDNADVKIPLKNKYTVIDVSKYLVNDANNNQNVKYLLNKDNQGRTLSKEQQEYFKDSKARNNNGQLETVYHTTTNNVSQFNEFNPVGTQFYRFRDQIINYFTDSKDMSGSYANNRYQMADTKKLNNIEEAEQWLKRQGRILDDFTLKKSSNNIYAVMSNNRPF